MKLEKFKEKNKKKIGIILFTITCILLISVVILYRTFAIFETNDEFNVINGNVEDVGDIYFAFYKDGVIEKEMPRKEEGYVLDESQSYCGVLGDHNSDIKVSMSDDEIIHVKGVTTSRTKCNLYFVKGVYILGKGIPLVTEGNGLYEVTHENLSGTVNDEGFKTTEYRYAGNSPNNYITINNETWRIIGLVNVMTSEDKVEQRVKIIRDKEIGYYSWDTHESENNGSGFSEWSTADLNKLLNQLYYNNEQGMCFNGRYDASIECSFPNGLKSVQPFIETVFWNTGSNGKNDFSLGNSDQFYEWERSLNKGLTEKIERTIYNKGNIGLMYPSDYGYAVGSETRNNCLSISMNEWRSDESCSLNNYLYIPSVNQWTMSPMILIDENLEDLVFNIHDNGIERSMSATSYAHLVRPVFYLKENVYVVNGSGTEKNPFTIAFKIS